MPQTKDATVEMQKIIVKTGKRNLGAFRPRSRLWEARLRKPISGVVIVSR